MHSVKNQIKGQNEAVSFQQDFGKFLDLHPTYYYIELFSQELGKFAGNTVSFFSVAVYGDRGTVDIIV